MRSVSDLAGGIVSHCLPKEQSRALESFASIALRMDVDGRAFLHGDPE